MHHASIPAVTVGYNLRYDLIRNLDWFNLIVAYMFDARPYQNRYATKWLYQICKLLYNKTRTW